MKALKGVLIYIGIILGSIVGLGLILLCIMYFAPSVRIFGVGVVHYNNTIEESPIVLSDYSGYSDVQINVNSKKININVVPAQTEDIKYSMDLKIFGISTEIVEYKVNKLVKIEDNTLQIFFNVSEPNGWIDTGISELKVVVPATLEFDLLTSSSSGDIQVGNDEYVSKVKSLNVTTKSGNFLLTNLGQGEDVKVLNLVNLNLSTEKGVFDFTAINNVVVSNTVRLVATDGLFKFTNLEASLDIAGDGIAIYANNIVCGGDGFKCISKNGDFKIKTLVTPDGAENTFITDSISLDIDEIEGKTGILTLYGDINIGILQNYTVIDNEHGKVNIANANDEINIRTTMGDINVDSYLKSGTFTSDRGNITVNSDGEYSKDYKTIINNVDGNVTVYNEINQLILTTKGRSTVEVVFGKIKEGFATANDAFQHKINTSEKGNCTVYIPTLKTVYFMFIAKGDISGEIAGFDGNNDYYRVEASDEPQYFPNNSVADETVLNASFEFIGKIVLKGYSFVNP